MIGKNGIDILLVLFIPIINKKTVLNILMSSVQNNTIIVTFIMKTKAFKTKKSKKIFNRKKMVETLPGKINLHKC